MQQHYVFTGGFKVPLSQLRARAESHGHRVTGAVTKDTDFLVIGENPGAKLDIAVKLGVRVITEEFFIMSLVPSVPLDTPPVKRAAQTVQILADQAIANTNQPRNAAKGDWCALSRRRIFWLFLVEVGELFNALRRLWALQREYRYAVDHEGYATDWLLWHMHVEDLKESMQIARGHVKHEAGDCVAFLAFLVDRL